MIRRLIPLLICALVFLPVTQAGGRPDKDWKEWFGHISGGYSAGMGTFGDLVDDSFIFNGGATLWPDTWPVGMNLDLAYSQYDFSDETLRAINDIIDMDPISNGDITGGDTDIWSVGVNAMWGPDTSGSVGFYLIGGIGVEFVEAKLTTQGLVYYPPICGWWWCVPGGVGPGTLIKASESTTEFGYNVGIGLTFELSSGSQFFIEAKYKSIDTQIDSIETLPIVVGWRW